MILAIIFLSGLLPGLSSTGYLETGSTGPGQSTATSAPANAGNTQDARQQATAPSAKPDAAKSAPTKPPTRPKTHHSHKKSIAVVDCKTIPAPTPSGTPATETTRSSDGAANATANPPAPNAQNCPPKRKIVPEGGSSEPSIQLAGSSDGSQASFQRDSTNQILGTTEQNLKKLTGRQLSENQQNMVSQARQFMDQAKKAIDAGDLDRARTLAWKAQLLSEDLVKPEN